MDKKSVIVSAFNAKSVAKKAHLLNMLPIVAVYKNPLDFPHKFVARVFYLGKATLKTKEVIVEDTYDMLFSKLNTFIDDLGLVRMLPTIHDDKCLYETWL